MVVTRSRGTAQAVAVAFRFRYIAETAAILRDGAAVPVAVASHCGQILERAIRSEHIYQGLDLTLEFPGVELVAVVRPPAMPELLPAVAEVDPHMADGPQSRVLLRQLGIEKPRFLGGCGADGKCSILKGIFQTVVQAVIPQCHGLSKQKELPVHFSGYRAGPFQGNRGKDGTDGIYIGVV